MLGWWGKIAKVDLSSGHIERLAPRREIYQQFIGGRGIAGHYLRPLVTLDWQTPEMPLLLFTGPLVGTASPTSGRMTIMSRSPLTGTVGDCSVGGSLGTELKRAGLDGLIIVGRSPELCAIEIVDDDIALHRVPQLKGEGTEAVRSKLTGKGAVAVIGPAAENGVLFSSVIVDGHHAAGRNGIGAVFAAKNIKYLTVSGTQKTRVCDKEMLKQARQDVVRLINASPALSGAFGIAHFGTGALFDLMDARCMMPTDNFRSTRFKNAASMNAFRLKKMYDPVHTGCKGCHIRCKQKARDGRGVPEFETLSHFSALLTNHDMEAVMEANRICNDLGMDTISAAVTLAAHAEIENRRLSADDFLGLLTDIGRGRGLGRDLGQGAARYAAARDRPAAAIAVKGQELSAYDPRGAYGMALGFATATRGGCHLRAYPISHEILRKPVATDRFSFEGKARIIKISEDLNAVADSLTACKFVFFAATLEEYAKIFQAVTGVETSGQDLMKIGERICYQERIMNAANGFSCRDDDLPERFFESPGYQGDGVDIRPIDRRAFLQARDDYYTVRGLDACGKPLKEKAFELGLAPAEGHEDI